MVVHVHVHVLAVTCASCLCKISKNTHVHVCIETFGQSHVLIFTLLVHSLYYHTCSIDTNDMHVSLHIHFFDFT